MHNYMELQFEQCDRETQANVMSHGMNAMLDSLRLGEWCWLWELLAPKDVVGRVQGQSRSWTCRF